jgi:hypothetical protein
MLGVGFNCLQTMIKYQVAPSLRKADFVIYDPAIEDRSFIRLDASLVDRGYEHTRAIIPAIRKALEMAPAAEEPVAASVHPGA